METFPAGGWELADYDAFEDWTSSLKTLGNSSRIMELVTFIYGLRIRFDRVCTVVSPEETSDVEDDEDFGPAPAFAAGTYALESVRRADPRLAEIDGVEYWDQDPKVWPSLSSRFPLLTSCLLVRELCYEATGLSTSRRFDHRSLFVLYRIPLTLLLRGRC